MRLAKKAIESMVIAIYRGKWYAAFIVPVLVIVCLAVFVHCLALILRKCGC